jgi:hypothetical protein
MLCDDTVVQLHAQFPLWKRYWSSHITIIHGVEVIMFTDAIHAMRQDR